MNAPKSLRKGSRLERMLRKARELGTEAAHGYEDTPRFHDLGESSGAYIEATEAWDEWSTHTFCDQPTHGRLVTVEEGNAAHEALFEAYKAERARMAAEKTAQGTDEPKPVQAKKSGRKRCVA